MFHAYPNEQQDLRWVSVSLTVIATFLLLCRLSATIKNRGWLGLEDGLVILANVRTDFPDCISSLTMKLFLIVFAAMVYQATLYGFGMRVVDIKRTGGDLKEAMKVRQYATLLIELMSNHIT